MKHSYEVRIFRKSLLILSIISISGIIVGSLVQSDVIFFDGLFALFGVLTTFITLQTSRYLSRKDDQRFPFGKDQLEPLVVFFQYLLLNLFLLVIFIEGIFSFLNGGYYIELGAALVYLLCLVIVLYFAVRWMRGISKVADSNLIEVELDQWEIEFKKGVFTLGSYLLSFLIVQMGITSIITYIDPFILVLFVVFTAKETLAKMGKAFKEMIGMSTIYTEDKQYIEQTLEKILLKHHMIEYRYRIKKIGSLFVVEISFLVDDTFPSQEIKEQDSIRRDVEADLSKQFKKIRLSVTFTYDVSYFEE